jgi:hypothetical protein
MPSAKNVGMIVLLTYMTGEDRVECYSTKNKLAIYVKKPMCMAVNPKKHPYKFGVGLNKYCRCLTKPKEE